ncbi:hypothetical protein A8950_1209 [Dongia mobilis]|uniref:Uncharacterized protein n=1 Tax=Dongia mobilis TaxID=578943 RepID=A0A4R6WSE8_9PROT|nr:hypothetical protein A8950_1209 [Dongia mobilis]
MSGNWLGLIELLLVGGLVLGWAVYELRATPKPGERGKSEGGSSSRSGGSSRHPEG